MSDVPDVLMIVRVRLDRCAFPPVALGFTHFQKLEHCNRGKNQACTREENSISPAIGGKPKPGNRQLADGIEKSIMAP